LINRAFLTVVLLLPLFFLPWGTNVSGMDNADKYLFLWLGTALLFLFRALFVFRSEKGAQVKMTGLDLIISLFLVVMLIASVTARDTFASLFGSHGTTGWPFFGLLAVVLFCYAAAGAVTDRQKAALTLKALANVLGAVVVVACLIMLGFLSGLLPSGQGFGVLSEAVGSLEELALLTALSVVLFLGLLTPFAGARELSAKQRYLYRVFAVLGVVFLLIVNFLPAWWALLAGLAPLALLGLFARGHTGSRFAGRFLRIRWRYVLIILALFYLAANYLLFDQAILERRYMANQHAAPRASAQVTDRTLADNPVIGFGPDNFTYAYSLYRPADINESAYWDVRFSHASSQINEFLVGLGLVGTAVYLCLLAAVIYRSAGVLVRLAGRQPETDREQPVVSAALAAVLCGLVVVQFFYTLNALLLALFFLFISLLYRTAGPARPLPWLTATQEPSRRQTPRLYAATIIGLTVLALGSFAVFFLEAKYRYASAVYALASGQPEKLEKAARLNPYRHEYSSALAGAYLEKYEKTAASGRGSDLDKVNSAANQALAQARQAVQAAPYSVRAYETLGSVYRSIGQMAPESNRSAAKAFQQAGKLEPTNPVLALQAGKSYYDVGDRKQAVRKFRRALELKPDYYQAQLELAKVELELGDRQTARRLLDGLAEKYMKPEVYYQRGKMYFNADRLDKAAQDFRRVLAIAPDHTNALYSLGLTLEEAGEAERALHYFQKVYELNPGHQGLEAKIRKLEQKGE